MKKIILLFFISVALAQDLEQIAEELSAPPPEDQPVENPFFTLWGHLYPTARTLPKKVLDFRVVHHFAKMTNGIQTFYGLAFVTDVQIAFNYGITRYLTAGISYNRGSFVARRIIEGRIKAQIMNQTKKKPLFLSVIANAAWIVGDQSPYAPERLTNKERLSSFFMLAAARKQKRWTFQLAPYFIYHPLGPINNPGFFYGSAATLRFALTPFLALLLESGYTFNPPEPQWYSFPAAIGVSIMTGGHVFSLRITNTRFILENQQLPFTTARWQEGDFRFAFTISRAFNL